MANTNPGALSNEDLHHSHISTHDYVLCCKRKRKKALLIFFYNKGLYGLIILIFSLSLLNTLIILEVLRYAYCMFIYFRKNASKI